MILLFIINTLFAVYTVNDDMFIYKTIAYSEVKDTLTIQGWNVVTINYMNDSNEVFNHFIETAHKGWTDHDTVLLSQLFDSFNTATVTVRKNGQKHRREIKVIEFVHLTTASSLGKLKHTLATYIFSHVNLGNANFDTDFFYWLLVYNRKPMYDKELNEKYTTMYKKYYCGAVKNYLK